jgi:hypothetical protein
VAKVYGENACETCGKMTGDLYGGVCIDCDAQEEKERDSAGEDAPRESVSRWHMKDERGRTFIMYGDESTVIDARAKAAGYVQVERSGHYSYASNTIVGARDGATVLHDWGFK